jgi:hypothetical protein
VGASASIRARNKHNVLSRHRGPADPATVEARRELKATVAEDYIRELVDQAPPLTPAQRDKLASLLRTPTDSGRPAA